MDFTTNITPKNVDNVTYNVAIIVRNIYYKYDTTC